MAEILPSGVEFVFQQQAAMVAVQLLQGISGVF
jgi:hypothetical protein